MTNTPLARSDIQPVPATDARTSLVVAGRRGGADRRDAVGPIFDFLSRRHALQLTHEYHCIHVGDQKSFALRAVFNSPAASIDDLARDFDREVATRHALTYRFAGERDVVRVALLISKTGHCMRYMLDQVRTGKLPIQVTKVISNHNVLEAEVEHYQLPFIHIPVERDAKADAEAQQLELIADGDVDLVVLARYMQIVSPHFLEQLDKLGIPIINIHHSGLPAFPGSDPYRQAYERGVKQIGATGHYVTAELDEGPIIAQKWIPVRDRWPLEQWKRAGARNESRVLAEAVNLHCRNAVVVTGNKTFCFDRGLLDHRPLLRDTKVGQSIPNLKGARE